MLLLLLLIKMFADDTKICREINNAEDTLALQLDLDCLENWTRSWQVKYSTQKCEVIRITHKQDKSKHPYHQSNTELKSVTSCKDLGVHVSRDLFWSSHVDAIVNKANKVVARTGNFFLGMVALFKSSTKSIGNRYVIWTTMYIAKLGHSSASKRSLPKKSWNWSSSRSVFTGFAVGEFYLREVLSHNSGRVTSFYQAVFEIFGYFSQKRFERNYRSLEAGALLL